MTEVLLSHSLDHKKKEMKGAATVAKLVFHVDVNSAYLSWEAARRVANGEPDIRLIPSVIGGDRETSETSRLRFEGCKMAFAERGIDFDDQRDYQGVRYSAQDGYRATKALLAAGRKFTAIFAIADVMAIGAIRALWEEGLRVPEDVSVMGVDGLPLGEFLVPQLATIRQNVKPMALRSVQLLLGAMEDGKKATFETVPFEVQKRESIRNIRP